ECKEQVNNIISYYKRFLTLEEANEEFERYQSKIKRKKEKLNSEDKIVIYTSDLYKDNQNGSYAGIGVYYEDGSKEISEPLPGNLQTNNHAELYAVISALETCEDKLKIIEIKSDSVTENKIANKLARRGAAIKMNKSKKLSPYNKFMKTNLPIIKKNNPDLDRKNMFKLVTSMWKYSIDNPKNK
ncbi:17557_t:CDS:2, partial [Cetraspora pellucida]